MESSMIFSCEIPVDPKPPCPLSVSLRSSTSIISVSVIFSIITWAILSPLLTILKIINKTK